MPLVRIPFVPLRPLLSDTLQVRPLQVDAAGRPARRRDDQRLGQTCSMVDASGGRSETHPTQPADVADRLADAVIDRLHASKPPLVVAIDGRSGAGKSTLARALGRVLATRGLTVTIIEGDDFYAGGTAERWDRRSAAENARHVID